MFHLLFRSKIVITKPVGQTPLEALRAFTASYPRYAGLPATYAGRLDPMASGKLVLLFGEECKKKEKYLGLDKEYEVEVLIGIESDTGDVLGLVSSSEETQVEASHIQKALLDEIGSYEREYPVFSSKTVFGKPLFQYALEGTLDTVKIPTHTETIYSVKLLSTQNVRALVLKKRISSLLALAPRSDEESKAPGADFRIDAVRDSWEKVLVQERTYQIVKIRVRCGSGTYMRTLAGRIGKALGTHALALSIHRTRVG